MLPIVSFDWNDALAERVPESNVFVSLEKTSDKERLLSLDWKDALVDIVSESMESFLERIKEELMRFFRSTLLSQLRILS